PRGGGSPSALCADVRSTDGRRVAGCGSGRRRRGLRGGAALDRLCPGGDHRQGEAAGQYRGADHGACKNAASARQGNGATTGWDVPAGFGVLAIMAKAPRVGTVKTRLVPPLTPDEAAELSRCFIRDVTSNIAGLAPQVRARGVVMY